MSENQLRIEVVYALADEQVVEELTFAEAVTIEQAICASSLPARFGEIKIGVTPVGVFGERRAWDWQLADRDRVEIYRRLTISPTDARRRRARIDNYADD